MKTQEHKPYTLGEEIANSIIHGIGAALAIAALAILTSFAALRGTAIHVVPCAIYGACMFLMFLMSTLYHALTPPKAKRVFQILDHEAIFLMIAGTYTPFTLITLRGPLGWTLFGIIWGIAVAGLVFQALFTGRLRILSTILYLAMGWLVVIALKPLVQNLPPLAFHFLWIGGLCYTLGAVAYLFKRVPYLHTVWHVAVLAGAVFHFFCILFCLPDPAP